MQERVRDLHVCLPRLRIPGWTNLVVVLNDVLVGTVECDSKGSTGAARCTFESRVTGDQVVSEDAAVTPATDTEPIRIGNTHLDHVIDAGEQILHFIVAPIGKDRARELLPPTGAAAVVHGKDGVTVRRKKLTLGAEGVLVLPVWTTVNSEQQRNFRSLDVTKRVSEKGADLRAVFTRKPDLLRDAEIQF